MLSAVVVGSALLADRSSPLVISSLRLVTLWDLLSAGAPASFPRARVPRHAPLANRRFVLERLPYEPGERVFAKVMQRCTLPGHERC